jgi:hypothetical protein
MFKGDTIMYEEGEELVVEEMLLLLEMYAGPHAAMRQVVIARLLGRRYYYYYGDEVRRRAREGLEMLRKGSYVVFGFDHNGPNNGRFIKAGSTVHNPEARARAHFVSSSPNPSNIIGAYGPDYVAAARFGVIVFGSASKAEAREMDRCLDQILKPEIGAY